MVWYLEEHARTLKDLQKITDMIKSGEIQPGISTTPEKDQFLIEIDKKVKMLEMEQGKWFYFPGEKIKKFFLQPHVNLFIHGANQSGKSAACTIYVVSMCEGWHPMQKPNLETLLDRAVDDWVKRQAEYLLENKLWIPSPPIRARCVGVDFPMVEKVLGPEYIKWASQTELDFKKINYDKEVTQRKIAWKNKSFVEFMTYKQEVISHAGAKFHVIHLDEEPSQEHYQQSMLRIAFLKGRIICGMTAEKGVSWTKNHIFEPAKKGNSNFYALKLSMYDNPIMSVEMINKVIATCLNQTEIDIRVKGEMTARGGMIFENWKKDFPFVVPRFDIPQDGGLLVMMIDPHPQLPHAVSWMWVDIEKQSIQRYPIFKDLPNTFVCAELWEKGGGNKLAGYIEIVEHKLGRKHDVAICDPRGWQKSQEDENAKSVVEQLNDAGIYPIKGSKNLTGGLLKLKECLDLEWSIALDTQGNEEKITREYPQLMFFDDQDHHLFEFENYRWQPPPMTRSGESKEVAQKPVDKDDHFVENVRRGVEWMRDQNFEIFDTPDYQVEHLRFTSKGKPVDICFEEEESMLIGT